MLLDNNKKRKKDNCSSKRPTASSTLRMQPACIFLHRLLPDGATALEIPSNRPAFLKCFKRPGISSPPTAVSLATSTSPSEPRLESATFYVKQSVFPEDTERTAYAYITPDTLPCRADPGPFLRRVFRTLALDLPQTFDILSPRFEADAAVRFRTQAQRDAAMRRQPFRLDGATVELAAFRLIPVSDAGNYMVHIALHRYPIEQRGPKDVVTNCTGLGSIQEMAIPSPDLSTVCAIVQLDQPREIPHELHIEYSDGLTSVIPIEILSVWECSKSLDSSGEYVHILNPPRRLEGRRGAGWQGAYRK